jgi:hypothetical protein
MKGEATLSILVGVAFAGQLHEIQHLPTQCGGRGVPCGIWLVRRLVKNGLMDTDNGVETRLKQLRLPAALALEAALRTSGLIEAD